MAVNNPAQQRDWAERRETYQQKLEGQLARWRAEILTMRAEADYHRDPTEATLVKMEDTLAELERQLVILKATPGDAWVELQSTMEASRKALARSFEESSGGQPQSEGWVEGMGYDTSDSEGWVEGMGHDTGDSEGWVEGMGRDTGDSQGWREGYDNRNP